VIITPQAARSLDTVKGTLDEKKTEELEIFNHNNTDSGVWTKPRCKYTLIPLITNAAAVNAAHRSEL
jgi:hypothetical protein